MKSKFRLYKIQRLIIICAPITDVIWYAYKIEDT